MVERFETFAENRGYRVDVDPSGRVMTLSDAKRFKVFAQSGVVIERTLEALEPVLGEQEAPLVVLRASCEEDAETARVASDALGFGHRVTVFVETASFAQRRAAQARLAESVTRAELEAFAPRLPLWLSDGLASAIAESVTDRAFVDGELVSGSSLRKSLARKYRRSDRTAIDLSEISGRRAGEATTPLEAESMRIAGYLLEERADCFPVLATRLAGLEPRTGESRSRLETDELEDVLGASVMADLMRVLRSR
ncbi:MAG: hypothetical protein AAFU73_13745 [Planctomycetota bacterium]